MEDKAAGMDPRDAWEQAVDDAADQSAHDAHAPA